MPVVLISTSNEQSMEAVLNELPVVYNLHITWEYYIFIA